MKAHAYRSISALLLVLFAATAGCSIGAKPKAEYFYYLTGPKAARDQGKGPRISLGDFAAAPGYGSQRVAYRHTENELRYYAYRRWVSEPTKMVRSMLMRHLRDTKRFSRVGIGESVKSPLAVLEGTIDAIEELDQGDKTFAHLAMTFVLRDASSDREIFSYAFDKTFPCPNRHPRDVAFGISKLLSVEAQKLAGRVAHALK